ncbi:MAG: hypothetical protein ABI672_00715 [Vicinamibacteria bacterium]
MVSAVEERDAADAKSANPPLTEGLNTLDRDRASSVADEGGSSAATVEFQRPGKRELDLSNGQTTFIQRPGK